MARFFKNRSTKEIVAFLIAHNFELKNTKGDDNVFVDKLGHVVKVTQNQKSTPIGTMYSIRKWSGCSKKDWLNWWKENGFGE